MLGPGTTSNLRRSPAQETGVESFQRHLGLRSRLQIWGSGGKTRNLKLQAKPKLLSKPSVPDAIRPCSCRTFPSWLRRTYDGRGCQVFKMGTVTPATRLSEAVLLLTRGIQIIKPDALHYKNQTYTTSSLQPKSIKTFLDLKMPQKTVPL